MAELLAKGATVGILADADLDEDVRSLRELLIYGLKGLAAYTDHAYVLDHQDDELLAFMQEALAATLDDSLAATTWWRWCSRPARWACRRWPCWTRPTPAPTAIPSPRRSTSACAPGPAILVSGHDLRDLDELLQQTAGTGINVYTHGEMLPANAYPAFKKYPHLVGNYGGSWWHQADEFETFGGAILMTTNCIVPPKDSYKGRLFTTGLAGWPGVHAHRRSRSRASRRTFAALIAQGAAPPVARSSWSRAPSPSALPTTRCWAWPDKVIAAIKSGAIKRFVVMAGCDGRQKARELLYRGGRGSCRRTRSS